MGWLIIWDPIIFKNISPVLNSADELDVKTGGEGVGLSSEDWQEGIHKNILPDEKTYEIEYKKLSEQKTDSEENKGAAERS